MAQSGSGGTKSGAKRKAAAKKGGQASARKRASKKAAGTTAKKAASGAGSAGIEAKTVAEFRDALKKNLIKPLEMVMLSRDRIEEVLGEAVDQGRITTRDAQRIATGLVKRGEKQTKDVLGDLEGLLGRGKKAADPALEQVDKLRRGAGVGPNFPIMRYDDLTAAQIQKRLADLTAPELRKVRDHERRNANRKTILNAIEAKLR